VTRETAAHGPCTADAVDAARAAGLSVVVVTYDSGDVLDACVQSLPAGAEVVVVDNGSETAPTVDGDRFARTTVIRNPSNVGFGAAMNVGAGTATGDDLLLINPDVRLQPGAIDALLARRDAEATECVVGPSIWSPGGELLPVCRRASRVWTDIVALVPWVSLRLPARLRHDLPREHPVYSTGGPVDYLQGCCLLVSRAAFARVGGFDPSFFLYCEEEDLCVRLREAGVPSVYEPTARVVHLWGTSTRRDRRLATQHEFRSRVLLHRKRSGAAAAAAYRCGALAAIGLHLALLPVQRLLGRSPERDGSWCVAAIRGLTSRLESGR
jgi:GT2 family glycosyltransferase